MSLENLIEQLEDELVFVQVQIDSLDSESDDYPLEKQKLEYKLKETESQLRRVRHQERYAHQSQQGVNLQNGSNPNTYFAQDRVQPGLSQNFPNGFGDTTSRGFKRMGSDSIHFDPSASPNKRLTPEPSSNGRNTPFERPARYANDAEQSATPSAVDLARQKYLQREAGFTQQQRQDYEIARRLSQQQTPSRSATPSSSRANIQSTFDASGGFQRPVIKHEKQPAPSPLSQSHGFHSRPQPYLPSSDPRPASAKREYLDIKQERNPPTASPHALPTRGRGQVVDLTGDSDDDVTEVQPPNWQSRVIARVNDQPVQYPTVPSHIHPGRSYIAGIPGAYPSSYSAYNPTAAGGPQQVYGNNVHAPNYGYQQGNWMDGARRLANTGYETAKSAFPTEQLDQLRHLITGAMHSRERASLQPDDDDMQIVGSRQIVNPYANHRDLWQQRYDTIASYDPEKTKEDIEDLLNNIRPDEDLPDDLLVRTPEEMNVRLHKYQELGLTWLKTCEESNSKGGILADDMGLGKTIQMLSLMVSHKPANNSVNKTTLIVAPVALMRQWKQEIADRIKPQHRLTVFIHHGASKKKTHHELMSYDVVITTFGSLASELKKLESLQRRRITNPDSQPLPRERCVLLNTDRPWYRIILDEAQCIKNRNTQSSRAACHLNAMYRFCCTGTPMMNNVEELYSLIKFLRIKPYCVWENFRTDFALPLKSQDERMRSKAMRKLQTVCKAIMLRRTKTSKHEGRPILVLPERTTGEVRPEFSQDESDFYSALDQKTQLQFNKYMRKGEVGTNYSAILVLLLRLRQACCHPHLIKDFGVQGVAGVTEDQLLEKAKQLPEDVVARIKEAGDNFECAICCDAHPNPAIFVPCGHSSCHDCFSRIVDAASRGDGGDTNETRCHFCRSPVDPKSITDFLTFKRVHWREKLLPEEMADEDDESDDSDDDSDDEEEDGNEDDTLDGFIVKDDVEDEPEAEDELEADDPDDDLDLTENAKNGMIEEEATNGVAGVKDELDSNDDLDGPVQAPQHSLFSGVTPSTSKGKGKGKEPAARGKQPKKSKKAKGKQKKSTKLTLAELKKMGERNMSARKKYLKRLRKNWISSAKIDQTMELLQGIISAKEGEKILIFSQWTSLLDLLEVPVDREGFSYRRYDGSMNPRARGDAVDDFRDPQKDIRIMLVSLKAGNAGLNLNMASQVILLDPFWNPYIEEQAIDRAHRLGQQRPVKVHRVLIKDTVEDRILQLQEQKRALISEALDEKASQSIGRLGVQELAYLFGVTSDPSQRVNYRPRERH